MISNLPTGTVTFLFTDIEGSSGLWERQPEAMKAALARHDALLRQAIESHGGQVVKTTGDGCHAVFASPIAAVLAAVDAQQKLVTSDELRVTSEEAGYDIRDTRYEERVTSDELRVTSEEASELETRHSSLVTLKVRVGIHTGEAELRDGDYFGPTVNRAARIMSIGHGGQVLLSGTTTSLVRDGLPPTVGLRDLGEHRLKDLSRPAHIFQVTADGLPVNFPPLRSLDVLPGNLPVQLTSFVGRERELAEVKRLLGTTHLLTLTGPGGTGKTRLSLQAAADVQADYAHGAWLVELAPLADPNLVPGAVAALFSLSPQPGSSPMDALIDYLRGKHLLLILDNCEHLVEACARLAAALLAVAPRLTILASSREGLGVPGETTFHVPTLALPAPDETTAAAVCRYDAADLFLQRAQAAKPDFAVTDRNAPAVAQIVRRLDGIPLAIELAAARVKLLAPEQIATRLDDRFRLLTGGSRTALPRQQTLRALIDWSYGLLDEREQWFFRQLGVFVGGWTLEAAEEVASDERRVTTPVVRRDDEYTASVAHVEAPEVLDVLAGLVNKSLVVVEEGENDTRYRYLETIRQYARDKLFESGEGEAARDRHMDYFDRAHLVPLGLVNLAGGVGHLSMTAFVNPAAWVKDLERNVEDVRVAIEWAVTRDPERALLMAISLALALTAMRAGDGTPAVREALAAVDALPNPEGETATARRELRTLALLAMGFNANSLGDPATARIHYTDAERLARASGNRELLARALVQRSMSAAFQNDEAAVKDGEEAAALSRELDEPLGSVQALGVMALFYMRRGDPARASVLASEANAISVESKDPVVLAANYLGAPMMARMLGDIPTAEALYRQGIIEFRRIQNRGFAVIMESDLAHMLREVGRVEEARVLYRRAIREWQDLGRRAAVANMLENFAFLARADRLPERAARLLGAAEAIRDEIQVDMTPWERETYDREVAALRDSMPGEAFVAEWASGRALYIDAAVDFAAEN